MVAAHASLVTTNAEHDQQIRFSTRSSSGSHIECVKNVGGMWDPKKGFALESSSHKCMGCQKNMPFNQSALLLVIGY